MQTIFIFLWIYAAMITMSFWESEVEGRKAWDKGKLGPKIYIGRYCLSAYHFWVFWIMWPMLIMLPLIIYGWDTRLFGILVSAYFTGTIIEDFCWYIVNPAIKFKESFNHKFACYYPWLKLGNFEIPAIYIFNLSIALLSWYLFWK